MDASISPGSIVWVELHRGGNKKRPAVALSSPGPSGLFKIIVGSRISYDPDIEVELPSNPNGHPRTKLRERTFVSSDWTETISISDVIENRGAVPPTTLDRIWDLIFKNSQIAPKPA